LFDPAVLLLGRLAGYRLFLCLNPAKQLAQTQGRASRLVDEQRSRLCACPRSAN